MLRLIGPVLCGETATPVPGAGLTTLVSVLAVQNNRRVSADWLISQMWENPPRCVRSSLSHQVARLRRYFGEYDDAVTLSGGLRTGLELACDEHSLDTVCFERAIDLGFIYLARRELGRAQQSAVEARRLWRGDPFGGAGPAPVLIQEGEHLKQRWHEACLLSAQVDAAHGRYVQAIRALKHLHLVAPWSESVAVPLVEVLTSAGRRDEALEVCRLTRTKLRRVLDGEPSSRLSVLETQLLA